MSEPSEPTFPFEYPAKGVALRHGPAGYEHYESYRPWLRDECEYRCVYCLLRERWCPTLQCHIDHLEPQVLNSSLKLNYKNLTYACPTCNARKSRKPLPSPHGRLTSDAVTVHENGRLEGHTRAARAIIRILGLDSPDYVEMRMLMIGIIRMAHQKETTEPNSTRLYTRLMSYPDDLPDLSRLKPPENSRSKGIHYSAFARRQRGELPDVY